MVRAGGRIGHPGRNREPQDPRPVGYSPEPFLGSLMWRWAQLPDCPPDYPEPGKCAQLPHCSADMR